MFSPQKCREGSQLSRTTTGHIMPLWGIQLFHKNVRVLHCRRSRLCVGLYSALIVWCFALKTPVRSSLSVGFIVFLPSMEHCPGWFPQPRAPHDPARVCVPSYVSLVPSTFIDIFVCCRHHGPPWVNINPHRQLRALVSWPLPGPSAAPPVYLQPPHPHPHSQYCYDVERILPARLVIINTRF